MSLRLGSLKFNPRGAEGWATGELKFGRVLTLAHGKNGSGKTPVLKGLMFTLGLPVELPPEIVRHCSSAVVCLIDGTRTVEMQRHIETSFRCTARELEGGVESMAAREFSDEKTFSSWLLAVLGVPEREFVNRSAGVVPQYLSVLAPVFWVDQDLSWRDIYCALPLYNFLKDQAEEVTRMFLCVPPRNRAVDKTSFARAKQAFESLQERVGVKRTTVGALRRELGTNSSRVARQALVERRDGLREEMRKRTSVLENLAEARASADQHADVALGQRDAAQFTLSSADMRIAELKRLVQELDAEVTVLESNETAADAFRALCASDTCQFFRRPEESYGRRVLYLKDQLKDFQQSFGALEAERARLAADLDQKRTAAAEALSIKANPRALTRMDRFTSAIEALSNEFAAVTLLLDQHEQVAKQQGQLENLIQRALTAEDQVNALRPGSGSKTDEGRTFDTRRELAQSLNQWLAVLNAQNLPEPITVDEKFKIWFGSEKFTESSHQSGSTRTRIVLAYHAALLETSRKIGGCHPDFLILDTPKQHELHNKDLAGFIRRFQELSAGDARPIQLIIGATDGGFAAGLADETWAPPFGTKEHPRFLGTLPPGPLPPMAPETSPAPPDSPTPLPD